MSETIPTPEECLAHLAQHLKHHRFSSSISKIYPRRVRRFLAYLDSKGLTVDSVGPDDVAQYLRHVRMLKKPYGRASDGVRESYAGAIRMLLKLYRNPWPPNSESAHEKSRRRILEEYHSWMRDLYGLSVRTCNRRWTEAGRFLDWWSKHHGEIASSTLSVTHADDYTKWRGERMKRVTIASVAEAVRCFARFLFATHRVERDLSEAIQGPKIYRHEGIPSALPTKAVARMLKNALADRTPCGKRNYAILMMLTTYGMRAGELVALRLEDIDWRNGRIRLQLSKTNDHSELPLLSEPGEALLTYLQEARPKSAERQVFLRTLAPYTPFTRSNLWHILGKYLSPADPAVRGKRGPHALRHARAGSLLRSGVPLKTIGDVLGHRSPHSTMTYLKVDTSELRDVALDLPGVPT